MSEKRSGPDVTGLLVLILALAAVAGTLYFVSRLSETAMNLISGAAALAIVSLTTTVGLYLLSRRDRPAAPAQSDPVIDGRYASRYDYDTRDAAPDQRSYIAERRQAAQLAELELRETKIQYQRELARAKMLQSANPTPATSPDTSAYGEYGAWPTTTPAPRPRDFEVRILGGDDDG